MNRDVGKLIEWLSVRADFEHDVAENQHENDDPLGYVDHAIRARLYEEILNAVRRGEPWT